MKAGKFMFLSHRWESVGLLLALLVHAGLVWPSTPIERMGWRAAPAEEELSRQKAPEAAVLQSVPLISTITLPPPSVEENFRWSLITSGPAPAHGFGRPLAAFAANEHIVVANGDSTARIRVKSTGAAQLRVGLRFSDDAGYAVAVYRPGDPANAVPLNRPSGQVAFLLLTWTPVTSGDEQEIFVERLVKGTGPWSFDVVNVSHIDGALQPEASIFPPGFPPGQSAYCQVDIVCIYNQAPPVMQASLPLATRAVSMLIATSADGNTFACTGTLLNSANFPAPLIYSANHCFPDAQSVASLTTFWFYSRDSCGFGPASANTTQVAGGAVALYLDPSLDSALVLMNSVPPPQANYSGWDASQITTVSTILAIHHPMADVKKGSFGNVVDYNRVPVQIGPGTYPPGTFYLVDWGVGIVEHGSSGSGLFTYDSNSNVFYTRGTLTGGNATCGSGTSRTYYSQMYNAYPNISNVLNVRVGSNYQGLWWNASESGWGINFAHQRNQIYATWYTYDTSGRAWWLSMLANQTSGNTYTGPIYENRGPPFNNYVGTGNATPVGSGTLTFSDANTGSFSYAVTAGGASNVQQIKSITRFALNASPQPTCTYSLSPNLAAATNYQDLWWASNGAESGWGINFAHQGNQIFATWYTYDTNGYPMWLSALVNGVGGNIYTGPIYRNSGPRYDAYNAAAVATVPVGTATLTFSNGNSATFKYSTTGAGGLPVTNQTKAITRFLFAGPAGTVCQ